MGANIACSGNAIQHRHSYVHQHHVRCSAGYTLNRLAAIVSFANHLDIRLQVKQRAQPFAEEGLVIYQKNPDHVGTSTTNSNPPLLTGCATKVPPNSFTRSATPRRPKPPSVRLPPTPLSVTTLLKPDVLEEGGASTREAFACLRTLF